MGWWPETGWTDRKISHIKIYGIGRYIIRKLHIKWNLMCAIKISSLSACLRDSYENVCCTFGPRFIRVSPESRSIYSCTGMTGTWECYSFGRREPALFLHASFVLFSCIAYVTTKPPECQPQAHIYTPAAEIQKSTPENWSDCGMKFTICSFFRRVNMVY